MDDGWKGLRRKQQARGVNRRVINVGFVQPFEGFHFMRSMTNAVLASR